MESPPLARYVPHSSKKRVFPDESSMEDEVVEISPPINRTSKSRKQKEIFSHDIIDVDINEDCDARHGEQSFIANGKGKEIFIDLSLGPCGGSKNTAAVKGVQVSKKDCTSGSKNLINLEDSDGLYGDNADMDMYYDDSMLDSYTNLQLYFDRMDVPPGTETSIPCWSGPIGDKLISTSSTPSYSTPVQLKTASISSRKRSSRSSESLGFTKLREKTSAATDCSIDKYSTHKYSSELMSQGKPQKSNGLRGSSQSKRKLHSPHKTTPFGSHNLSNPVGSSFPIVAVKSLTADWMNFPPNLTNHSTTVPSIPPIAFPGSVPNGLFPPGGFVSLYPDPITSQKYTTAAGNAPVSMQSASSGAESKSTDEIVERFRAFKKFDTVQDYSDHHYSVNSSKKVNPASKAWVKRIQEEWKILEKDLPDTIYVRVYESRMDLLRAVIIGADGTPYHDGLFFFDVYFPSSYPNVPPQVYYHSGGLRINPNLYNCGKVCLSLLNTWSGHGKEKWIPRESTMLQVLVSIQGLILNAKPYFNEPGYASSAGTARGEQSSLQYNENTYISNLRTMVYSIRKPPKHFEDFVVGHFVQCAHDILVACKTYIDGAQVGSLVSGGVQDVDEGDKSCSGIFKNSVAGFIKTLVESFTCIGAKGCDKFLYLAEKATGPAVVPNNYYY